MQTAGQTLDEKDLSEAMKETGLGTPATRAATIEVLLKRGFIVRAGKNLEATDKGMENGDGSEEAFQAFCKEHDITFPDLKAATPPCLLDVDC